jgi:hypothetical protein
VTTEDDDDDKEQWHDSFGKSRDISTDKIP